MLLFKCQLLDRFGFVERYYYVQSDNIYSAKKGLKTFNCSFGGWLVTEEDGF